MRTFFFQQMYGNGPDAWSDTLTGADRLRVIVNALTRLRYCTPEGAMEFKHSGGIAEATPAGYVPWFDAPARQTTGDRHGVWPLVHAGLAPPADVWALDSGCVWGGCLSALRVAAGTRTAGLGDRADSGEMLAQSQEPGD